MDIYYDEIYIDNSTEKSKFIKKYSNDIIIFYSNLKNELLEKIKIITEMTNDIFTKEIRNYALLNTIKFENTLITKELNDSIEVYTDDSCISFEDIITFKYLYELVELDIKCNYTKIILKTDNHIQLKFNIKNNCDNSNEIQLLLKQFEEAFQNFYDTIELTRFYGITEYKILNKNININDNSNIYQNVMNFLLYKLYVGFNKSLNFMSFKIFKIIFLSVINAFCFQYFNLITICSAIILPDLKLPTSINNIINTYIKKIFNITKYQQIIKENIQNLINLTIENNKIILDLLNKLIKNYETENYILIVNDIKLRINQVFDNNFNNKNNTNITNTDSNDILKLSIKGELVC